jgi:hypothetical protein
MAAHLTASDAKQPAHPPGSGAASGLPVDWSWHPLLDACRKVARAKSIIAVDGDGLPVAWMGLEDRVEAERIAAHVARAFDLLDNLKYVGRFAECLCTMYWPEGTWLTAVRLAPKVSRVVTIAMVGPYTLVAKDRQRLRNTFVRLLEESWPA